MMLLSEWSAESRELITCKLFGASAFRNSKRVVKKSFEKRQRKRDLQMNK